MRTSTILMIIAIAVVTLTVVALTGGLVVIAEPATRAASAALVGAL